MTGGGRGEEGQPRIMLLAALLLGAAKPFTNPPRVGAPAVAGGDLFTAPADRSQEAYAAWARNLSEWRAATRAELDLGLYDEPSLAWAATSFVETQAMIHDRMLFDRATHSWTVDRCAPVPIPLPSP